MITLPNECLYEIFIRLRIYPRCLFSCLLVNRQWCRNIVPILWSEPSTIHLRNRNLTKMCILALNAKEQAQLIPLKIILPDDPKPLFNYTTYITSIDYTANPLSCEHNLTTGITNWLKHEGFIHFDQIDVLNSVARQVKRSLIAMFLRTCINLKCFYIPGSFVDLLELEDAKLFLENPTLTSLNLANNHFSSEKGKLLIEA
ncbi:f-box domain-containing protein [Gigaspora margarita]|uniref:F-box domain-containing protein n=1 Tax=Gigaspora margarita TaxID=4874 RepID=A0A8H4AVQ3_GIGMA|nr:f-box domain-containing protein [Gigaspora margarita]